MVARGPGRRKASPLLKELRRWARRTRRGELPPRAQAQAWLAAVTAARAAGDEEAPKLAASLGAILRLGAEAVLTRLEEAIGHDLPLPEPVLTRQVAAELKGDLDAAEDLGADVTEARARLSGLWTSHLEGRLLALEALVQDGGAEAATRGLSPIDALWDELVEAEAYGAPNIEPLAARLADLQAGLEALAQAGPLSSPVLRPDPLAFLALLSRAGSLGRTVLETWAGSLARRFAGRPGWDEFVAQLQAMAPGAEPPAKAPSTVGGPEIGAATRAPLPPTLAAILDFVRGQEERTAEFLAGLLIGDRQVGAYSMPEMPLVQKTEVQLDWVAGEPDPWERGDLIARARTVAGALAGRGVQLEFIRGRPVSLAQYDPSQARRAADFSLPGPLGPVVLEPLEILERAVPVAQRPGFLQVLLAPIKQPPSSGLGAIGPAGALTAVGPGRVDSPVGREVATALAEGGGSASGLQLKAAEGAVARDRPALVAPAKAERVRVELDWVSGQDPWKRRDVLARAREAARRLQSRGVRLELVRGRQVPAEQYVESRAKPSRTFSVPGPRGPVSLGDLDLLERAIPLEQRPGLLHVLVAPPRQPGGVATGLPTPAAELWTGSLLARGSREPLALGPGRGAAGLAAGKAEAGGLPLLQTQGASSEKSAPGRAGLAGGETGLGRIGGAEMPLGVAGGLLSGDPALARSAVAGRVAPEEAGAAAVLRESPPERVRVELDWVSGQDPWERTDVLAGAREAARRLQSRGVRLELVRGRQVPAEQYVESRAKPSRTFSVPGPRGPVALGALRLLDRAVPIAQRPGLLRVLLAPPAGAPAGPGLVEPRPGSLGGLGGGEATVEAPRGPRRSAFQPTSAGLGPQAAPGTPGASAPGSILSAAARMLASDNVPLSARRPPVPEQPASGPGIPMMGLAATRSPGRVPEIARGAGWRATGQTAPGRTATRIGPGLGLPATATGALPTVAVALADKSGGRTTGGTIEPLRAEVTSAGALARPPLTIRQLVEPASSPARTTGLASPLRAIGTVPSGEAPASGVGARVSQPPALASLEGAVSRAVESPGAASRPLGQSSQMLGTASTRPAALASPLGSVSTRPGSASTPVPTLALAAGPGPAGSVSSGVRASPRALLAASPVLVSRGTVAEGVPPDAEASPAVGLGPGPLAALGLARSDAGPLAPAVPSARAGVPGRPMTGLGRAAADSGRRLGPTSAAGRPAAGSGQAPDVVEPPAGPTLALLPLRRHEVARAAVDRPSAAAPESRPAATPRVVAATSGEAGAPEQPNLDALARQVYAIIRQRLAVERERIGGGRAGRPW